MTKPLTKRQLQAIETKQRIYDSAIHLFKEKGYFETTTRDISEAASVSQGLIFNYFKNKEAFLSELFKTFETSHQLMYDTLSVENPIESIIQFCDSIINWYRLEFGYKFTSVILSNQILYTNPVTILEDKDRVYYKCLTSLIQKAVDQGSIREDITVMTMTDIIVQSVIRGSLVQWCLQNGEFDVNNRASETLSYLVESYKK